MYVSGDFFCDFIYSIVNKLTISKFKDLPLKVSAKLWPQQSAIYTEGGCDVSVRQCKERQNSQLLDGPL